MPDFSEPCVTLSLFPLVSYGNQLNKTFGVFQFPNHVCGMTLLFPKAIQWEDDRVQTDLADLEVWDLVLSRIKKKTALLRLKTDQGIVNTRIRVSPMAKADLKRFQVLQELGAEIPEESRRSPL